MMVMRLVVLDDADAHNDRGAFNHAKQMVDLAVEALQQDGDGGQEVLHEMGHILQEYGCAATGATRTSDAHIVKFSDFGEDIAEE